MSTDNPMLDEMYRQQRQDRELERLVERRYEIARDASRMLIARDGLSTLDADKIARQSVEFADALIAELQRPTADNTDNPDDKGNA